MNTFALNVFLALAWTALVGRASLLSLAGGFVIGFAALWLLQPLIGGPNRYFRRVLYVARLIVMFHYELLSGSLTVAREILTPRRLSTPAIVEMPLDVRSEVGVLLVANLISLTPGTLSLDVAEDRGTLRLHAMFAEDPDAIVKRLKGGVERWVRDAVER